MKGNRFSYSLAVALAAVLPKPASRLLAKSIAAVYSSTSKDLIIVKDNLREALGHPSDKELTLEARQVIQNFSFFLVDLLYSRELSNGFIENKVRIRGLHFLDEALAQNKGAIVASAHVGHWELAGMTLARLGYPLHAVAMKHRDAWVNAFFQELRSRHQLDILPFGGYLRRCYEVLKNNEVLGLNGDRLFSGSGVPVNFFGKEVLFPQGPARIGAAMGAPVLPCFFFMDEDRYLLEIRRPLSVGDERQMTQEFAGILEKAIRERPTQWLIFQRFWEKQTWPE